MKKIITTLFLLSSLNIAHAQTALQKENFEKNIALNLVKQYVTSIACDTSFERSSDTTFKTSLKDVFTIQAPIVETPENNEASQAIYYVLWQGNKGCQMANNPVSTSSYFVTEVISTYGPMYQLKPLVVNNGYFEEGNNPKLDDAFEFNKHAILAFTIDKITKINNQEYDVFSRDYAPDDINFAPSLVIQTRLKYSEEDKTWNKVFRKVIDNIN